MRLTDNLIHVEKIKRDFSEGVGYFLEGMCETLPPPIAFYEENSMCTIKRKSCKYVQFNKEIGYVCRKKTYTLLENPKPLVS